MLRELSEPGPRSVCRLHRITWIVLGFVLILVLVKQAYECGCLWEWGWPAVVAYHDSHIRISEQDAYGLWLFPEKFHIQNTPFSGSYRFGYCDLSWLAALAFDLGVAVGVLGVCATVCEFGVRRMKWATALNRCLRFHLCTLILLTLMAGGLLGANIRGFPSAWHSVAMVSNDSIWSRVDFHASDARLFGWPVVFRCDVGDTYRYYPLDPPEKMKTNLIAGLMLLMLAGIGIELLLKKAGGAEDVEIVDYH